MADEMRIPDIEIVVGASGNDVAVFAFYRREDLHQGYEVVSLVTGKGSLAAVRTCLQDCITAINTADWHDVDVVLTDEDIRVDEAPF